MSAQFGDIPIGAMMYDGVIIGEAMMDGNLVYASLPYPISNTWDLTPGSEFSDARIAEHEILATGSYTITNTVTYVYGASVGTGSVMAVIIVPGHPQAVGSSATSSTATTTVSLVKGNVVTIGAIMNNNYVYEGNWSIVKN